jgi:CDP-glucose 4,6-dehydratase
MTLFGRAYAGRRVLITGHTGFKGSWLSLWLTELGANVTGLALSPNSSPNHWDLLHLDVADHRADIRDASAVAGLFAQSKPEIVFHLAAQPLVRRSYRDPLETWSSNVMGTAHMIEASRQTSSVRAVIVITTDKVYTNREGTRGYRENDRLGGHDPYSASKAAAELVVDSYRKSFCGQAATPLLATARAGNVVGGGDWSEDRLIPDLVRAVGGGRSLEIRSPGATRPWQHVLECLSGYLLLGQKLLEGGCEFADAWNFGPDPGDHRTVGEVLTALEAHWPRLVWHVTREPQPHEAGLLHLDCAKARAQLGWRPVWKLEQALEATAHWYRTQADAGTIESSAQLARFVEDARSAGQAWAAA